jgi:hypothetical protein
MAAALDSLGPQPYPVRVGELVMSAGAKVNSQSAGAGGRQHDQAALPDLPGTFSRAPGGTLDPGRGRREGVHDHAEQFAAADTLAARIRMIAWSRAFSKSRAFPPPVTSRSSLMKSPANVFGLPFTSV